MRLSPLALVSSALKLSTFEHIRQLHGRIISFFFHQDNYWVAQLLIHCTRLRAPSTYVRSLFLSTPYPNLFSFTNLLNYYFQLGAHRDVHLLFDQMRIRHVKPDAFVFSILIRSCGNNAFAFHAYVLKSGHYSDQYIRSAMMDAYAKSGLVSIAREVFDEIPDKVVADWNTILSGFWKWGHEGDALLLFQAMPEKNVITWTNMVTGYSMIGDLESARKYFEHMPERNLVSWNAMLSGYTHRGHAGEALSLFKLMLNNGIKPDETTCVTIISVCSSRCDLNLAESIVGILGKCQISLNCFVKTALVDMYAKCGSLVKARRIFDEMGVCKNLVTWNVMISAYMHVGDLTTARELFMKMPRRNAVSWNSMISGYAQNGQSVTAIDLFKEMIKCRDVEPDELTMVSVFSSCGHIGALEFGKWGVNYIAKNNLKLSISGYNSLIFMYSKCGSIKGAEKSFEEIPKRDVVSYNAMISGYAAHGLGKEALKLMSRMIDEGIEPDRITFLGCLTACSHSGMLEDGRDIFETMEGPDVDHYACMIDLLGRVGRLDEAMKMIGTMPMEPHAGVYGSFLNACRIHKRIDLGELAAEKLFEIEPQNPGNYVLLSNMYSSLGRWGDVDRIRNLMEKRGLRKGTAWSWVEFGGRMHKFVVGDKSHHLSNEIYGLLTKLNKKMKALGYMADGGCVLRDVEDEEKEEMVRIHSEKLAVAFTLLVSEPGEVVRVVKNLRVCCDCHTTMKMISKLEQREIILRDNNRFHCFNDGLCSCGDYW